MISERFDMLSDVWLLHALRERERLGRWVRRRAHRQAGILEETTAQLAERMADRDRVGLTVVRNILEAEDKPFGECLDRWELLGVHGRCDKVNLWVASSVVQTD